MTWRRKGGFGRLQMGAGGWERIEELEREFYTA